MNVDVRTYDRNFFKHVKGGETFSCMKEIFMKFDIAILHNGYLLNAVSLNTGRPIAFLDDDLVTVVKTRLVNDEE